MTTSEAVTLGVPRWMVLAMPEDVTQVVAMVHYQYCSAAQQRVALRYELRKLRREVWERSPTRPIKTPHLLRPSKVARVTGYRSNSEAHKVASRKRKV